MSLFISAIFFPYLIISFCSSYICVHFISFYFIVALMSTFQPITSSNQEEYIFELVELTTMKTKQFYTGIENQEDKTFMTVSALTTTTTTTRFFRYCSVFFFRNSCCHCLCMCGIITSNQRIK